MSWKDNGPFAQDLPVSTCPRVWHFCNMQRVVFRCLGENALSRNILRLFLPLNTSVTGNIRRHPIWAASKSRHGRSGEVIYRGLHQLKNDAFQEGFSFILSRESVLGVWVGGGRGKERGWEEKGMERSSGRTRSHSSGHHFLQPTFQCLASALLCILRSRNSLGPI